MEELIVELQLFLQLLDHEYLTSTVREKKAVLNNILLRIQATKDVEVKENVQRQETAINLPAPPQMPLPEIPQQWLPPDDGPPPLPSSSLPEGYYEEALPLSPGKAPEYITSNYDSDAMSSSYESYDEEDEDGKGKKMRHQWPSEEASMDLVKDAKICVFLLRKKNDLDSGPNYCEVAVLEASSSEDMGRWIGILLAESGSSADPGTLHYDYIDVDVTASVIQAAKQTFCFMNRRVLSTNPYRGNATNGYACPSGMALHYDDVPCINGSVRIDFCFKGKKMPIAANEISGKGRTLSNSLKKSEFASNVKRSSSNADQYKYGKNRVEADAKRLQTKEEELLKKKEILRNHLAQL
ncbi:AFAP1: Actin filament associated protein 1 [Crotalus adamanteus]|uniref:AFAP1: Actin filament associated protein 1 n=1 Tax=Crotalus adamanteus TaxID=8729 RepID=A0AAW1BAA8_CROAD